MNTNLSASRRTFLKASAVTGLAVAGIGGGGFFVPAASAQNGDNQAVCTSDNVNIRERYGLSGRVIGTLNTGDIVNLIGNPVEADGYSWFNVNVAGTNLNGWVASDFLDQGSTGSGWPAGTKVHVNSDNVNLRSGAGLGHDVFHTFDAGANATIISGPQSADGYTWYKVSMVMDGRGMVGWMAAGFLDDGRSSGDGDGNGFPPSAWVITTTSLNLRSGPGTGYGVIVTYSRGEAATVITGPAFVDGYSWYKVEMAGNGGVGWFAGEYLDYAPTEPIA